MRKDEDEKERILRKGAKRMRARKDGDEKGWPGARRKKGEGWR